MLLRRRTIQRQHRAHRPTTRQPTTTHQLHPTKATNAPRRNNSIPWARTIHNHRTRKTILLNRPKKRWHALPACHLHYQNNPYSSLFTRLPSLYFSLFIFHFSAVLLSHPSTHSSALSPHRTAQNSSYQRPHPSKYPQDTSNSQSSESANNDPSLPYHHSKP